MWSVTRCISAVTARCSLSVAFGSEALTMAHARSICDFNFASFSAVVMSCSVASMVVGAIGSLGTVGTDGRHQDHRGVCADGRARCDAASKKHAVTIAMLGKNLAFMFRSVSLTGGLLVSRIDCFMLQGSGPGIAPDRRLTLHLQVHRRNRHGASLPRH